MEHLAISSDWLPIDRWISEAIDQSLPVAHIESDLVDCTLFWSTKHSLKGASSRDSLAKSLEAVRILVSLGIEYPTAELSGRKSGESRLRDFFKAPFTKLKELKTPTRIDTILGMDSGTAELRGYWTAEGSSLIEGRLYAQIRDNYERALASASRKRQMLSLLKRLIKITGIPLQMDEAQEPDDFLDMPSYIRTLLALKLNRIQRPSKLRKVSALSTDFAFKGFEPLTVSELKTVFGNAALAPKKAADMNREHAEIFQRLALSPDELDAIGFKDGETWVDYIARIKSISVLQAKEQGSPEPLVFFEGYFACDPEIMVLEAESDDEILEILQSIFIEADIEYSGAQLVKQSGMEKAELEKLLKQGEKLSYLASRKDGGKKLYSLIKAAPPEF